MGEPLCTLGALSSSQFWALRFSTYSPSAIKFRCCILCCSGRVEQMVPQQPALASFKSLLEKQNLRSHSRTSALVPAF